MAFEPFDKTTTQLLKALSSEEDSTRRRAAMALGKINSTAAVTGLLQALHDEPNEVRGCVAWALAQIGTEAVVIELIDDRTFVTSNLLKRSKKRSPLRQRLENVKEIYSSIAKLASVVPQLLL